MRKIQRVRLLPGSLSAFGVLLILAAFVVDARAQREVAVAPAETIDLLADPSFGEFTMFLNLERSLTDKRESLGDLGQPGPGIRPRGKVDNSVPVVLKSE